MSLFFGSPYGLEPQTLTPKVISNLIMKISKFRIERQRKFWNGWFKRKLVRWLFLKKWLLLDEKSVDTVKQEKNEWFLL